MSMSDHKLDTTRHKPSGHAELYDIYNEHLISSISTVVGLQITQRPITDEEYNSLKGILEDMRQILFSLKE